MEKSKIWDYFIFLPYYFPFDSRSLAALLILKLSYVPLLNRVPTPLAC
jgi:hypothetical protein